MHEATEEKKAVPRSQHRSTHSLQLSTYLGPLWPFGLGVQGSDGVRNGNQSPCFPPIECSKLASKYNHFALQSMSHAVISMAPSAPSASHSKVLDASVLRKLCWPSDKTSKSSAFSPWLGSDHKFFLQSQASSWAPWAITSLLFSRDWGKGAFNCFVDQVLIFTPLEIILF